MLMQIEINYNDVLIENQRVNRPSHMSPKAWCDYWDDVVWSVANKKKLEELEEQNEHLLAKVRELEIELNGLKDDRGWED
jgi:hypothetical protein